MNYAEITLLIRKYLNSMYINVYKHNKLTKNNIPSMNVKNK